MKTKHTKEKLKITKGEWIVAIDEFEDGFSVQLNDNGPGISFIAKEICQGEDQGEADAKLIAAAPELLEELKETNELIEELIGGPVNLTLMKVSLKIQLQLNESLIKKATT